MAVYLSQHGKSASKDIDPKRGLTEAGAKEVKYVASLLQQRDIHVAGIRHSGKDRAQQTADIFAKALNPEKGLVVSEGMDPLDDVAVFATQLDASEDQMYVGHLPFMQRLVSYLIVDDPERPVVEFNNGGVVCLDYDQGNNCWIIKWVIVPHIQ